MTFACADPVPWKGAEQGSKLVPIRAHAQRVMGHGRVYQMILVRIHGDSHQARNRQPSNYLSCINSCSPVTQISAGYLSSTSTCDTYPMSLDVTIMTPFMSDASLRFLASESAHSATVQRTFKVLLLGACQQFVRDTLIL